MKTPRLSFRSAFAMASFVAAMPAVAAAQRGPSTPQADSLRQASKLDLDGEYAKARAIFQKVIEGAPDPAAKSQAQRALAISYAFTGECASAAILENRVIDYWVTREKAEPQNAFYQEGEISNEAARICFDAGDYDAAEQYYRRGSELGLREPEPKTHPASLWDFRLTHALARIDVRRGNAEEAGRLVDRARKILDGDKAMAAQQERFFPYLQGYVEMYTPFSLGSNIYSFAERDLKNAVEFAGNENDPYVNWLLSEFYAIRRYSAPQMMEYCRRAISRATAHNPPSAFVHAHAKECLDPLLLQSGIQVPAQINVADEGEDGRIEWSGGPDHTAFLPARLVQFQVKATDMGPAKCAAEMRDKSGALKGQIRGALAAGGAYVVFCNRPMTHAKIEERAAKMRDVLSESHLGQTDASIFF